MNWKNQLQKLGLNESELSISLKKKIKDYYTIEKGINQLTEKIKEEDDDEEIANMQESLQELKSGASELNDHLVEAIDKWFKNKDVYKKRSENLKNHRTTKKEASTKVDPSTSTTVETAPASTPAPTPVATPSVQIQEQGGQTEQKEEKKSSNFLVWMLGVAAVGLVAVVTLGKVRE